MVWTLVILFAISAVLLAVSFFKAEKASKTEAALEQLSISFMEEIHELKTKIRNFELDAEIAAQENGGYVRPPAQQAQLRMVLDLHKRGYSPEGIASELSMEESEVTLLLTPYIEAAAARAKEGRS